MQRMWRRRAERRTILDPEMRTWVAPDGEYWHESVGVFARNPNGTYLFLRRNIYPVRYVTEPQRGELEGR
jgi:hypothetical protein